MKQQAFSLNEHTDFSDQLHQKSKQAESICQINQHELSVLYREMIAFAQHRLSDSHLIEDVVQEALLGALKNIHTFVGKAALKTWVFSVLKNKIADALRANYKQKADISLNEESEDFSDCFLEDGHWSSEHAPIDWQTPEQMQLNSQLRTILDICLNQLPNEQGRAFLMKEVLGVESQAICQSLSITSSNLNVLLYRARMRLRECLELKWFNSSNAVNR
jgi:RNA polymerase sigma-70 factor (ECF subfamily)